MKINKILYIAIFCISFSSCGKWLTVEPTDQISGENLYSNAEGYHNQINGIYKTMASASLYGRELTWGFTDALAQYYDYEVLYNAINAYEDASKYNYTDLAVQQLIDPMWTNMFNAIANCNDVITHIEKTDPLMFYERLAEKNLILGEAYALRAMLHFDVLRLFAPAPVKNSSEKLIPYVNEFPTKVPIPLDSKDVLKNIIADLESAEKLTALFDTTNRTRILNKNQRLESYGQTNDNRFISDRGYRLNHYAIKALIARVCLYAGDEGNRAKALRYAEELINLNKFKFTSSYHFGKGNIKLYDDVIFALYNNKLKDSYNDINIDDKYFLTLISYGEIYGGDKNDLRGKQWIVDSFTGKIKSIKLCEIPDPLNGSSTEFFKYCNKMIPMLKISEMYYIAAECTFSKDRVKAKKYLTTLIEGRFASAIIADAKTQDEFNQLILNDCRREFQGDGQLFFFYKRLNLPVRTKGLVKLNLDKEFVMIIPTSNDIN